MNPTKLRHLEKDEMLSKWQKEQIEKKHKRDDWFYKHPDFDPFQLEELERKQVAEHIPALSNLSCDVRNNWSSRRRCNREFNKILENDKMMKSMQMLKNMK